MTKTFRRIALATVALAALPFATPALARSSKSTVITMPASTLKDPAGKLCMPKSIVPKPVDAALPDTVCQTQDEWSAMGVTFRAR